MINDGRVNGHQDGDNEGITLYREVRRRHLRRVLAALAALSVAGAAYVYISDNQAASLPWITGLLGGAILLLSLLMASWLMASHPDERSRLMVLRAGFFGMVAFAVGYPTWLVLWMGRVAEAPDALTLYFLVLSVCALAYLRERWS
jgi:hypothetical protein